MAELLHIILDPAHWVAELVMDVVFAMTIGKLMVRRHDARHHGRDEVRRDAVDVPIEWLGFPRNDDTQPDTGGPWG